MSPLLEHWLGYAYGAHISGNTARLDATRNTLRERFAADQNLRAEAEAEMARIEALAAHAGGLNMLHRRCHVSAVIHDTLSSILTS